MAIVTSATIVVTVWVAASPKPDSPPRIWFLRRSFANAWLRFFSFEPSRVIFDVPCPRHRYHCRFKRAVCFAVELATFERQSVDDENCRFEPPTLGQLHTPYLVRCPRRPGHCGVKRAVCFAVELVAFERETFDDEVCEFESRVLGPLHTPYLVRCPRRPCRCGVKRTVCFAVELVAFKR